MQCIIKSSTPEIISYVIFMNPREVENSLIRMKNNKFRSRQFEDFTPEAREVYKNGAEQYKNVKMQVSAMVFSDRNNPALKSIQEFTVRDHSTFSNYFTDFDRAITYVKDKMKQMEDEAGKQ